MTLCNHVNATMAYGDVTASGIFTINDMGEIINFEAQRYGEFEGKYSLETWSIDVNEYKEFGGIMVPTVGSVTWKLDDGYFNWYNFELTEIEFNVPEMY